MRSMEKPKTGIGRGRVAGEGAGSPGGSEPQPAATMMRVRRSGRCLKDGDHADR